MEEKRARGRPKGGSKAAVRLGGVSVPATVFPAQSGKIETIPANVVVAVQLALRGLTYGEIAQRLFVNKATITRWMAQYADYVDGQIKTFVATESLLKPLVHKAIRTYGELLDREDVEASVKQRVASDVLDRSMGKPVQRSLAEEHKEVKITYNIIEAIKKEDS